MDPSCTASVVSTQPWPSPCSAAFCRRARARERRPQACRSSSRESSRSAAKGGAARTSQGAASRQHQGSMASAAAILADARKEELEFVRPFHPVLRRPEQAFAKQYRQLDDLQVDVTYTGFKKDDRDFLYKLFAILGDETRKDYISWCPEGRLLIVKKWRVLVSDGHLTAHDIDDTQFMAHLRVYNFRQLDKNQQRRFLPSGDSKWLLFLNPVVNLDQGDGVLKKYIRYCQVHRLKALVEKQSPEAGFIQACRQVLLQTAPEVRSIFIKRGDSRCPIRWGIAHLRQESMRVPGRRPAGWVLYVSLV